MRQQAEPVEVVEPQPWAEAFGLPQQRGVQGAAAQAAGQGEYVEVGHGVSCEARAGCGPEGEGVVRGPSDPA
ncbi:hypothetical protein ACH4C2_35745 [Streptomyces sp. NPDC018057]|uniref:hypothetical protein n=1 Tax=unclassified Streptomyces TaxID=2593676 RepID=UPI0037A0A83A